MENIKLIVTFSSKNKLYVCRDLCYVYYTAGAAKAEQRACSDGMILLNLSNQWNLIHIESFNLKRMKTFGIIFSFTPSSSYPALKPSMRIIHPTSAVDMRWYDSGMWEENEGRENGLRRARNKNGNCVCAGDKSKLNSHFHEAWKT